MIITERDDYRQMMVLMQEHLKRVGINVELNKVDHAFYHARSSSTSIRWCCTETSPSRIRRSCSRASSAAARFAISAGLSDPTFDKLLDKIAASTEPRGARKLLRQAQQQVAEQAILVPTTYTVQPLIRNKQVDLGYELKTHFRSSTVIRSGVV